MRKFELHLDALVTLVIVFLLAFSFILYQRYQYSDLLQENVDLLWKNGDLEAEKIIKNAQLKKCNQTSKEKQEKKPDRAEAEATHQVPSEPPLTE